MPPFAKVFLMCPHPQPGWCWVLEKQECGRDGGQETDHKAKSISKITKHPGKEKKKIQHFAPGDIFVITTRLRLLLAPCEGARAAAQHATATGRPPPTSKEGPSTSAVLWWVCWGQKP